MSSFRVETAQRCYSVLVERGLIERAAQHLPAAKGKIFVVTTQDVWAHQGERLERGLAGVPHETLYLPGGEERKRFAPLETLADEMVRLGGDRSSLVIGFGGGVVNDMAGFLASIFMRGIPVVQVPTTLLAQVDAAIGGKTGVNLVSGKNLIGTFHQPVVVLTDTAAVDTLPEREYRAGLFEVVKHGVIRDADLFHYLVEHSKDVLARAPDAVTRVVEASVRIKAEVVSADEREGDLRRILNFGHTFGHALEAETGYSRLLHGEAVAFGMKAAVYLAERTGHLSAEDAVDILHAIRLYGPIPSLHGISSRALFARLASDKKTQQGKVHFVLAQRIGEAQVATGFDDAVVLNAIESALA